MQHIQLPLSGIWFARDLGNLFLQAGVSQAGAWTGLQFQGHGDMQWFDSTSAALLGFSYDS